MSENSKAELLREQVKRAGEALSGVMEGVNAEMAHWAPGGRANSIAANAAHVISSVDGVVNGLLRGQAPLMMSMDTGMSEPPPHDENRFNWHDWGTRLEVDLDKMQGYAKSVLGSADEYLGSISDSELEKMLETAVGERSVFDMLNGAVLFNLAWHTGEISSLKGQQGEKGYPF